MLRGIGRWLHGVSVIDNASEEEQRAFVDAIMMGLLVDGCIDFNEQINLFNFMKLINWKFDLDDCIKASKAANTDYLEGDQRIAEFVEVIDTRIPDKKVKEYLIKKFYMYFLEESKRSRRMGFPNLEYYKLMKDVFLK